MPFDLQPILKGELVEIRPLRSEDFADLYAVASDPLIYNGEMKRLMLQHAFRFVNTVVFLVGPQNLRSQRALEKIGAVRVGSRLDESGRDLVLYEITAAAFTRGATAG